MGCHFMVRRWPQILWIQKQSKAVYPMTKTLFCLQFPQVILFCLFVSLFSWLPLFMSVWDVSPFWIGVNPSQSSIEVCSGIYRSCHVIFFGEIWLEYYGNRKKSVKSIPTHDRRKTSGIKWRVDVHSVGCTKKSGRLWSGIHRNDRGRWTTALVSYFPGALFVVCRLPICCILGAVFYSWLVDIKSQFFFCYFTTVLISSSYGFVYFTTSVFPRCLNRSGRPSSSSTTSRETIHTNPPSESADDGHKLTRAQTIKKYVCVSLLVLLYLL